MKQFFNKKVKLALVIVLALLLTVNTTFAAVLFASYVNTKGNVQAGTVVNVTDATSDPMKVSTSVQELKFQKAGDTTSLNITLNNYTDSIIEYQYEFSFDSSSFTLQSESFASAILVYYNDEFVDTLGNLCANSDKKVESGYLDFTGYCNKQSSISTDTLRFELHASADGSIFDTTDSLSFSLNTYAHTVDYEHNMFVNSFEEFTKAVDDLNTGILPSDECIVLLNDISVTSNDIELKYPVCIDLNGNELILRNSITFSQSGISNIKSSKKIPNKTLNGNNTSSIIVDNEKAVLNINDFYYVDSSNNEKTNIASLYSSKVTLINYDSTEANKLIVSRIKDKVKYGLSNNETIDILGGLAFYKPTITCSTNLTYSIPNLTKNANEVNYSSNEYINVNDEEIYIKLIGTDEENILKSLLENELKYLVKLTETEGEGDSKTIVNTNAADLFLPTSIKDKNIVIEWKSSNASLMSDDGIISNDIQNDEIVTITGYFTINNKVLTYSFEIKISSQNHETIFQYFVAQLSPITIETLYTGTNTQDDAYYYLPIVGESTSNKYDYRNSYVTPKNIKTGNTGFSWDGFSNVGLEEITYSQVSTYNFISLDQSATDTDGNKGVALYLDTPTFETFAQINIVGKFANDDTEYEGVVNVIISPGYDTSLNDLVFEHTEQLLNNVDVLQNILDTRKLNTMAGEKGDFTLDGTYNTYYIQYTIPSSSEKAISKVIGYSDEDCNNEVASISGAYDSSDSSTYFTEEQMKQIVKYKICLNPEGFNYNESQFGVNVILMMPTTSGSPNSASRIQYFTCPGVIKCDSNGFSNMSVFNSVKYQVWTDLKKTSDESYNNDVKSDDYTLSSDNTSFTISNNVVTNHTGAYILKHDAYFCTTLAFDTTEKYTSTDNHIIYGLSKLIDWATSSSIDSLSTRYKNDVSFESSFISTYGSYVSNGASFLNTDELAVIKAYYVTYINKNLDDASWNTIINNSTYRILDSNGNPKYSLVNAQEFGSKISAYFSDTSTYGSNQNSSSYSKFLEVQQWAHNDKDFTADGADGTSPCLGVTGTAVWSYLIVNSNDESSSTSDWSYSSTSGWSSSKYAKSDYAEDNTSYITRAELEIILAFLLNSKPYSSSSYKSNIYSFVKDIRDNYFTIPTYFNDDGIATLISQAYSDLGLSLSGTSTTGFSAEISEFKVAGVTFTTPHVTLLDASTAGLDYFPNLTTLYIHGDFDNKLRAFHQDNTLTTLFNRIISNNTKLVNLALEFCSDSNMSLELDNIYKLENLEVISFRHNQAISNIGALLKLNLSKLSYVDVSDINLKNEYSEFTLQAINLKSEVTHTVYYSIDGNTNATEYTEKLPEDAEGLIYLEEFYTLLAENAQLTQYVYDEDKEVQVQWAIEEGNGLTYIDSSKTSSLDSISYPYTNYYFVTSDFTYNGTTFTKNHLYKIYSSDNGKTIAFIEVKDDNGNAIELLSGEPSDELTSEEKEEAINGLEKQTIEEKGDYSLSQTGAFNGVTISSSSSTKPSNSENSIYASSSTSTTITCVCYDSNGKELYTYSSCYSFGYLSTTLSRTLTYIKYDDTLTNGISTSISKYYYVSESGHYNIYKKVYDIYVADKIETTTSTREDSETFKCWYVSNYRTGRRNNYTYTFINLLGAYPSISYIVFDGTTYYVNDSNYGYSLVTGTPTSTSSTEDNINNVNVSSNEIIYSAMNASSSLSSAVSDINKTISITNSSSYYDNGTSSTITSGVYNIGLSSDGFAYTSSGSSTAIQNAKYMYDILTTANTHLNDAYFGLYYHKYYAYGGSTATYNGITFTQQNIYYLEIGSDGKFYWAQDSNTNARTYTVITGTSETNLVSAVGSLSSSDEGKIYYYSGSAVSTFTLGTSIWFKVVYNSETGSYEFRRFGTLSDVYLECSSGTFIERSNSLNSTGLKSICNIVEYMDTNFFSSGSTSTNYTYGIGGTRTAVIKAIITVNGVKYERLFVVKVIG